MRLHEDRFKDIGAGVMMGCLGVAVLWVTVAMTPTLLEGLAEWIKRMLG